MSGTSYQEKQLLKKVKRLVIRHAGDNGVRSLSRCFRVADDDGDNHLDEQEFAACLATFGLALDRADIAALMKMFDVDGDGRIGIQEFLTAFRVGLGPKRKAFIQRVFARFDQNGDGRLTLAEIRNGYRSDRHPDVVLGKKTEEDVLATFLASFDNETNPDGVVSKQEFEQYYTGISAGVADDDDFVRLLRLTWRLDDIEVELDPDPVHPTLDKKEQRVDLLIARQNGEKIVEKLCRLCKERVSGGLHGLNVEFRRCEVPGHPGFVRGEDLLTVLQALKLHYQIPEPERNLLRVVFDTRGDGMFDFWACVNAVVGDLPPRRLMNVERTWRRFPRDASGRVSVEWMQDNFVPQMLPQVARGETSVGAAMSEFLDAWDVRYFPDGRLAFRDFEVYYTVVSERVPLDSHFETMMKVSWKVWGEEAKQILGKLFEG